MKIPDKIFFVSTYNSGDIYIPIIYIIDFINKYKYIYKTSNTKFIISCKKQYHIDLKKIYNIYFDEVIDKINYKGKNLYYENDNFYIYYWCRHIVPNISSVDVLQFSDFFKQLFDMFDLNMKSDLTLYIPRLNYVPDIEHKKNIHLNQINKFLDKNKKTVLFFNCNALSTPLHRNKGYDIDILLNNIAKVISCDYNIVASHKYNTCAYEKNIFFMEDILNKNINEMLILDYQIQSFFSDYIIGAGTGVLILCQYYENKDKTFLVSGFVLCMHKDVKRIKLDNDFEIAQKQIEKKLMD